jgi:hypothetical protein
MSRYINQYTIQAADNGFEVMSAEIDRMRFDLKTIPYNKDTADLIKQTQAQITRIEKALDNIHLAFIHMVSVINEAPDRSTVNDLKDQLKWYRAQLTRRGINPNHAHYEYPQLGTFKPVQK